MVVQLEIHYCSFDAVFPTRCPIPRHSSRRARGGAPGIRAKCAARRAALSMLLLPRLSAPRSRAHAQQARTRYAAQRRQATAAQRYGAPRVAHARCAARGERGAFAARARTKCC